MSKLSCRTSNTHVVVDKMGSSRGDMKGRLNNFSVEEVVLETPRK